MYCRLPLKNIQVRQRKRSPKFTTCHQSAQAFKSARRTCQTAHTAEKASRSPRIHTSNNVTVKKIKAHLIHKAQLKRDLARLKSRTSNDTAPAATAADDG